MPQIILEFSSNIIEKDNIESLMERCNISLSNLLPTKLINCKNRAIKHDRYFIGDGNPNNAFVHLNLKLLPGRNAETLQNVGNNIMQILTNHFAQSIEKLKLQITFEINELPNTYFKTIIGNTAI